MIAKPKKQTLTKQEFLKIIQQQLHLQINLVIGIQTRLPQVPI